MLSVLFKGYRLFRLVFQVPLVALGIPYHNCRFIPTCSEYCEQAIHQYGWCKGVKYCIRRIGRCRPGIPGGFDPLP